MEQEIMATMCGVEKCDGVMIAKNYCSRHYQQVQRWGKILAKNPRDKRPAIIEGGIAKIPLCMDAKDGYAIVDVEDAEWISQWNWFKHIDGYACRSFYVRLGVGKYRNELILMHRLIQNTPDDMETDHIDRDRLNNRRSNLRIATKQQNIFNRSKRVDGANLYTGVYYKESKKRWEAYITYQGITTFLGMFKTPEEAAYVYDQFALQLFGEFARCNIL